VLQAMKQKQKQKGLIESKLIIFLASKAIYCQ
jgi:hypothetical protein